MPYKIRQWSPWVGEEEKKELITVIDSNWLTEAHKTREFERLMADFCGTKYAVATTSGGVALYLSMLAVGVKPGDEVIVPDYQMIALAHAVKMIDAKPVLADVHGTNGNIKLSEIEKKITSKTKCIVPVHMNGRAADIKCVLDIAYRHDIPVIEDACQSLGSQLDRKQLGSFADAATFSFHPSKIITTGQGGVVVTNNEEIYERVCRLKDYGRFGRGKKKELPHYSPWWGMNFRFTEMQAALGIAQLTKLEWRIKRIQEIYAMYRKELSGDVFLETQEQNGFTPWVVDVAFRDIEKNSPERIKEELAKAVIETRLPYVPLHMQPLYEVHGDFSGANSWSSCCLWLPSSTRLTDEEIETVIQVVREVLK